MPENTPVFNQHPDELIKKVNRKSTTPEAPEAKEPAAEEVQSLEELKKALPALLFEDAPPKKKEGGEPKPEEKKSDAEPPSSEKKVDAKAPESEPEPEEKKPRVRKAVDAAEIAQAAARETGKIIAETIKTVVPQPDNTPANDPLTKLSPEDRENYELFKVLSDSDPRYKGKHDEFLKFVGKLSTYRRKWEKDNPGQTFDSADDAHEDFYSANQPEFDENDLDKARIRLETRREVEKELKAKDQQVDQKLREIEEKAVSPEVARQAAVVADGAIGKFVHALPDPTLKEALKEPTKLQEQDPVAFDVLNNEAGVIREAVTELHNIIHRKNYFNPSNPTHMKLAAYIDRQEQFIKNLPVDKQIFEGRRFATREEYFHVPQNQKSQYWILTEDDVVDMITSSSAAKVARDIKLEREKVEQLATRYGFKKDGAASGTTQPKSGEKSGTPTPAATKPKAPSGVEGGALPPTTSSTKKEEGPVEKQLVTSLFI